MTREELVEDVAIGNTITIHTDSKETPGKIVTYTGQVIDLGTSGIKINLGDSTKRISYSRIIEYDIEEDTKNTSKETDSIVNTTSQEGTNEKFKIENNEENFKYKGIILKYNKEKRYGFIKESNSNETIYFQINQVSDKKLQKILNCKANAQYIPVLYTKGINHKGRIAADAITIDEQSYESKEGYIQEYNNVRGYGKISSEGDTYNFQNRNIEDPLLLADIQAHPFNFYNKMITFKEARHYNEQKQKTTLIAYNIACKKKYTQEEINDFLNNKIVTKEDVDNWLKQKDEMVFYEEEKYRYEYEKLDSLPSELSKTSTQVIDTYNIHNTHDTLLSGLNVLSGAALSGLSGLSGLGRAGGFVSGLLKSFLSSDILAPDSKIGQRNEGKKLEEDAVAVLLPAINNNPFVHFEKDILNDNTETAYRFLIGSENNIDDQIDENLKKAARNFISEIRLLNPTTNTINKLIFEYTKNATNAEKFVQNGLYLLEHFKYLYTPDPDKLTNQRKNLILRSGNKEACKKMHESIIKTSDKKNDIYHSMCQLSNIYIKDENWASAIKSLKESLEYLDKNFKDRKDYDKKRQYILNRLIEIKYKSSAPNQKEEADKLRNSLKSKYPNDVVKDFNINDKEIYEATSDEEIDELTIQGEPYREPNELFSPYLVKKLKEVNLNIFKIEAINSNINKDGEFIGSLENAKKAISALNRYYRWSESTIEKINCYMAIAKIIVDYNNHISNSDNKENKTISNKDLKKYIGRSAKLQADKWLSEHGNIDSIRYMYILAINNLLKNDKHKEKFLEPAIQELKSTFDPLKSSLSKNCNDIKQNQPKDNILNSIYKDKDLLITTFMLSPDKEIINSIINDIACLDKYFDFFESDRWTKKRNNFYRIINAIKKELPDSINMISSQSAINKSIQTITKFLEESVLWEYDKDIIKNFILILGNISEKNSLYITNEKLNRYIYILTFIKSLKDKINESPTELTFDFIYQLLETLEHKIVCDCNAEIENSKPKIVLKLKDLPYVKEDKTVNISIIFENSPYKQDAEDFKIKFSGSNGAIFNDCRNIFSKLSSGESHEVLASFKLNDEVTKNGAFYIKGEYEYHYMESIVNLGDEKQEINLPVSIRNGSFNEIENKYFPICRQQSIIKYPDMFKGRDKLINDLCNSLQLNNYEMRKNFCIPLWGQRRVGKNSVKDYLKKKINETFPNAYLMIDCGSIGIYSPSKMKDVLDFIITQTKFSLKNNYKEIYQQLLDNGMTFEKTKDEEYLLNFIEFVKQLTSNLKSNGNAWNNIPLFIFDEFSFIFRWTENKLIEGQEFMQFWKAFIQDYDIAAIIIIQDNYLSWEKKYPNEFKCMNPQEISYLDENGAKALICEPLKDIITVDEEAVNLIFKLTLGSALLIVIICKTIIDYLNKNYLVRVSTIVIEQIFKEFIVSNNNEMITLGDFEAMTEDTSIANDENRKENQKQNINLLTEIAKNTINSQYTKINELTFFKNCEDRAQAFEVLTRLKDRKIIKVRDNEDCAIVMPLFQLCLLKAVNKLEEDIFDKIINLQCR